MKVTADELIERLSTMIRAEAGHRPSIIIEKMDYTQSAEEEIADDHRTVMMKPGISSQLKIHLTFWNIRDE